MLVAGLRDVTVQIAMGKKTLPDDKRMLHHLLKGSSKVSPEEQMALAESGRALFEKKRLERIAKRKAQEALEAGASAPKSNT